MVENISFATFKSRVQPLEPKLAPINSMSCAADKDLLLSLEHINCQIWQGSLDQSISNMATNAIEPKVKAKIITSFLRKTKVENSTGDLTTDV